LFFAQTPSEEAFTKIYETKHWGANEKGEGFSGPGSTVRSAAPYMKFVQDFIKKHNIRTIVDVGCGDWTFSQYMDWNGAEYTGYDIVKSVIEKNTEKFASSKVAFVHGDATKLDLPAADLLICKDVLQHLPNAEILAFLKQASKFKHCLITNDINPSGKNNWDIPHGSWHYVDLSGDPFNAKGGKIFRYTDATTKLVFHIEN
ncbi:MAG: hypothetical protein K1000chlam3_01771, partial [Chlamydiae bacterium]|nr:hypothetical protein [Chlamydiota bacterium]